MYSCMCQTTFAAPAARTPDDVRLEAVGVKYRGTAGRDDRAQAMEVARQGERHGNEARGERRRARAELAQASERRRHGDDDAVGAGGLSLIEQGSAAGKNRPAASSQDAAAGRP